MTTIGIISWIHTHTEQTVALYSIRWSPSLSEKKINRDMLRMFYRPNHCIICNSSFERETERERDRERERRRDRGGRERGKERE